MGADFDRWEPALLYRFLTNADYVQQFKEGRIRISTLESCRQAEEKGRRDEGEAIHTYYSGSASGHASDPDIQRRLLRMGVVGNFAALGHVSMSGNVVRDSISDAFVLCMTVEYAPEKMEEPFGPHCIRVNRPLLFCRALTRALNRAVQTDGLPPLRGRVTYRDREYSGLEPEPGILGLVKPESFAAQREYRLVWTVPGGQKIEPFVLQAPEVSPYVSIMPEWGAG